MQPPCLTGLGSVGPLIRGPVGMAPGRGDGGPERPRGATRPPAGRQLQGVRVLIVEDEALVAINLETMLEDLGGEVCGTAAAGQEAVRKARQLRPTLIQSDDNDVPRVGSAGRMRRPTIRQSLGLSSERAGLPVLCAETTVAVRNRPPCVSDAGHRAPSPSSLTASLRR